MPRNSRSLAYFEVGTVDNDGAGGYHDDEPADATTLMSQRSYRSYPQRIVATHGKGVSAIFSGRRNHPTFYLCKRFPYLSYAMVAVIVILIMAVALKPTPPPVELRQHYDTNHTTAIATDSRESKWNDLVTYFLEERDQQVNKNESAPSRCYNPPHLKKCSCQNPVVGAAQHLHTTAWKNTFNTNLAQLKQYETRDENSVVSSLPLDVLMVGDSITERWQGRTFGHPDPEHAASHVVYLNMFVHISDSTINDVSSSSTSSKPIHGLALGIAGDRIPQVLYRLENGILSSTIQPKVWWLLIGTNDMAIGDWCSVDAVVAGIVRITQVILQARPESTIVVNSVLPLGDVYGNLKFWYGYYDQVNYRLESFAASTDRVEFYNATALFLNDYDDAETSNARPASVNMTLLPDGCHPGAEGYHIWGTAIIKKVREIVG